MRGTYSGFGLITIIGLFIFSTAHAGLGENETSIDRDSARFNTIQKTMSSFSLYRVHNIIAADNTVIKEYVNSDGLIFGIICSGIVQPDLTGLLGSYFSEYQNAKKWTRVPGQRFATTKTSHIVVEEGGHMRSSYTKAWIPSLMPTGMDVDEIR